MLTEISDLSRVQAQIRARIRMKPGGVTERRRGLRQARINAKHDLMAAVERLHRQDGMPEAYRLELRRWAALLGYRLDAPE